MKQLSKKVTNFLEKVGKIVKVIGVLAIIVLTYFASNQLIDFLLSLNVELLKRGLNIILVVLFVWFISRGERRD